ncbi:MAG: alpha/beta hydrolase [Pseudomonadota bacterium]
MSEAAFADLARRLPAFDPDAPCIDDGGYCPYYQFDFLAEFQGCRHSLGQLGCGTSDLAVQCWQQPDAQGTLYLVHGLFDHVGIYGHLIRFGLAQSFNVVAFDLPGHGLSSGARAEIEDFAQYRQAIETVLAATAAFPGPRHVIAQSTGGAAVMDYLQRRDCVFTGVVLLAPLIWPQGWRRVSLAHSILRPLLRNIPRSFAENSNDQGFLRFLRQDPLQPRVITVVWLSALKRWLEDFLQRPPCSTPLLVLQGDDDTTVDWRRNLPELQRRFPRARIETLAGARHHLANEHPPIRDPMLARIAAYLADSATPA